VVEHFFRHESGRLVATLTRAFGIENLTLAEDVVQDALVKALTTWPYQGVPRNPAAWITQVARRIALDVVRRKKRFQEKQDKIIATLESSALDEGPISPDDEIGDDRLRLMFACCHPVIPMEAQVALTLKTLCGFGVSEISSAFLCSDAAISKRLTRARQGIRQAGVGFCIPEGEELSERLDAVLSSLYLLFNEGYKASQGNRLVKRDLCDEAIRLTGLLVGFPGADVPKVHALRALMCLNASRLGARTDGMGQLLRLRDQDRSKWDARLISLGMKHFAMSGQGGELTEYHLQAAIAAAHCRASDYVSTNWELILSLYDHLAELSSSPLVVLNRAVALAEVRGPEVALKSLENLDGRKELEGYHLLDAVKAEMWARMGCREEAASSFQRAIDLCGVDSERTFLIRQKASL